jgi:hypothetical protein
MADLTNTITSTTLQPEPKLVVPAPVQDKTPYENIINGALTGLPTVQAQVDQANKDSENLLSGLLSNSRELTGKEQYSQDQQNLAGVEDRTKELDALNAQFTDLGAQIKGLSRESLAAPLKVQDEAVGQGVTTRVAQGQTEAEQRKNAIKALTLASEADILGARVTNAESRLTRAKEKAQKAVDLKYKPIEAEVTRLKELLDLNKKYILDPAEKKLAEKQAIALNERERILKEKKEEEKTNNDLIINAQSQLAPPDVIERANAVIKNGGSTKDVVMALGKYAGEYQQALMLQEQIKSSKLNQELTRENILQTRLENAKKGLENAALVGPTSKKENIVAGLGDTVKLIDSIKTSSGLSGFVGPVGLTRLSPITSFTGEGQNFIAGVQQLTSKQTLDTLINLKAAGGTLGALSEGERSMLMQAGSKINSWAITEDGKPDGKVIGYKIDEANFKKELNTIRDLTNRAIVANGGQAIPDASVPNKFQQSLGITSTQPFQGSSIISGTSSDGTFKFEIPKANPTKK